MSKLDPARTGHEEVTSCDEDFARIEQACGLEIPADLRLELLGAMTIHVQRAFMDIRSSDTKSMLKDLNNFKRQLNKTIDIYRDLRDSQDQSAKRTFELLDIALRGRGLHANSLQRLAETLDGAIDHVIEAVTAGKKIGRATDTITPKAINLYANIFEKMGGTPSAAYQQIKGRRDTPFLRFLKAVAESLPKEVKSRFLSGLDDATRNALKQRKAAGKRSKGKNLSS